MSRGDDERQRLDNGLHAPTYVPLTDVDAAVGRHLLTALGRARIAAYLSDSGGPDSGGPGSGGPGSGGPGSSGPAAAGPAAGGLTTGGSNTGGAASDRRRLFVASDERVDARTIVAAAVRALGTSGQAPGATSGDNASTGDNAPTGDSSTTGDNAASGGETGTGDNAASGGETGTGDGATDARDPDADTAAAFEALVAGWRIDTVAAVRAAERDLTREDADWRARLGRPQASDEVWLDEDHYVPPPPPPLPRLAGPTIIGMFVMVVAILVLALGGYVGLAGDVSLVMGIGGLVVAAGIFFTRIRDHHRDEDDDGSAV